ncbi:MAG: glycosyltransferase [Devosia sp.]
MRVLHVYKAYRPDNFEGIPRVIWELAEGLAPLGIDSDVFCLSESPDPEHLRIGTHDVYRARQTLEVASTGFSLSAFSIFRRRALAADIVHYHYPWPMMDVLHAVVRHNKPSLVTYHSDVVRQRFLGALYRPLMWSFLSSMDCVVATSPNYAASSQVLCALGQKVVTIPIGIGPRAAPSTELVRQWRERVGDGFFLFVGVNRYYKGLGTLHEAAQRTGLPLVIAGKGHPLAAAANVTVLGEVSDADKEALLELCTALVLPSHLRSEAYGIVLVEAARAARPMISCEIGTGTSFINIDGKTGNIFPPSDSAALAAAMQQLMQNRELARHLGAGAESRYRSLLTAERMAQSYAEIYQSLDRSTSSTA